MEDREQEEFVSSLEKNKLIYSTAEKSAVFFLLSICGELDGKRINGMGAGFPRMLRKTGRMWYLLDIGRMRHGYLFFRNRKQ